MGFWSKLIGFTVLGLGISILNTILSTLLGAALGYIISSIPIIGSAITHVLLVELWILGATAGFICGLVRALVNSEIKLQVKESV